MDDQNQLNQYTNAFDSLRNSINQLSTPLNNLSTTLNAVTDDLSKTTDAVKKLSSQNQDLEKTSEKSGVKLKEIADTFLTWKEVISTVRGALQVCETALKGWSLALTGGLTALTILLPELLNLYNSYIRGKEATDSFKKNQEALTSAFKNSLFTKAVADVTELTSSIKAAKNGYIDKADVLKKYNGTLGETLGKTNSLDEAQRKLTSSGHDYIKMMFYKAAAASALSNSSEDMLAATQDVIEAEKKKAEADESLKKYRSNAKGNELRMGKAHLNMGLSQLKAKQKAAAEELTEAQARRKAIEDLTTNLYSNLEQQATQLLSKITPEPNAEVGKPAHNKQYWENELTKQQELLDSLDVNSKNFEKEAKAIKNRIIEINKTLANYSITEPVKNKKSTTNKPTDAPIDHPDKTRHLEAVSISFAETIEARQKNYENELADLKDQQSKKLITQDEYFKQWAAIQEKHHMGIIESSKLFMEKKLDETRKLQQKIAEQNQKDLIAKDEKEINKALLPAEKLKAEIKLIEDKYAYELTLAAGNADKINQIEEQKQNALSELHKKHEQDRKNFQLETAQQVSDTAFSILKNNLSSQSSARIKQLQTQKESELNNTSLTATQRKAIEEKYKKKEAEEKVKAFKAEQRASILQAVINGALAITKVTSQAGLLGAFVIPGIIASTAIQVATIASQKAPQYAKGGVHYRSDGKGALLSGYSRTDDTNAYLRSGEAVVVSEAMRNPWARNLVSAINVAYGGRDFSVANTGSGYAIGGIYTDGGNSNRYYSQPANDVKDLANTLAYQMINNFPPVYVDVKDINTQQSILAKTVERVNL